MDKLKELINRLVDVKKLIITVWIMLWVVLIILDIFKLCFNVWYPVVLSNQKFISVCNFIDNHEWLKVIIFFVLYWLSSNIIILTMIKKYKYYNLKQFIIFNMIIVLTYIVKNYNLYISMIVEFVYLFGFTIFINLKYKPYRTKLLNIISPIIIYVLLNVWQSNMAFVKGLSEIISDLPSALTLMLQLDYYVFLIITWIGVSYIMGLTSIGFWWSRQITRLTALKEKELKKECPDMDVVAEYDARIKVYEQKLKEAK